MLTIDVDTAKVYEITIYNDRFINPFLEPYGYYIWINQEQEKGGNETIIELYLNKLKYACKNTDRLINQAFQTFQSKLNLSKSMWQELVFDSFVLISDNKEISCCLSNPDFMFGHYIECTWDFNWNLISICYC